MLMFSYLHKRNIYIRLLFSDCLLCLYFWALSYFKLENFLCDPCFRVLRRIELIRLKLEYFG